MRVLYASKAMTAAAYRAKVRALAAHADVHLLVPERWGRQEFEECADDHVAVRRWRTLLHGHNHLHAYPGAPGLLREVGPDIVHIDEEPYSLVTWQLARACAAQRIPCLFFAWQNLHKRIPQPFRSMRGYVFRHAAGGIAGTESAADVLRTAGCTLPIAVIPQVGVDATSFAPDPEARLRTRARLGVADAVLVGFAGRLVREKGIHVLIEALRRVPAAHLVVLGDGPERRRLEQQATSALPARAHFLGRVPSTAVAQWLAALDVLVLPSLRSPGWQEQFGRVLIEAMACGVPVVGSNSGEIPNVIGDAGLVVPEADVAALGGVLGELASAPTQRRELGERARRHVLERYTHAHIARATADFYETLLGAA